MILFRLLIVCCAVLVLSGCREQSADHDFLMTHPKLLEQEANRCQAMATSDADCEVVRRAANDFANLVNERGANPEDFGKRVLAAQTKLSETHQALLKANGSAKDTLEKDYKEQQKTMAELMAVVSATTGIE